MFSLSTALYVYHVFMVRTFEILSSGYFEIFNTVLLTTVTLLCHRAPEHIPPIPLSSASADQSSPSFPPPHLASFWQALLWMNLDSAFLMAADMANAYTCVPAHVNVCEPQFLHQRKNN